MAGVDYKGVAIALAATVGALSVALVAVAALADAEREARLLADRERAFADDVDWFVAAARRAVEDRVAGSVAAAAGAAAASSAAAGADRAAAFRAERDAPDAKQ
jgi:hypothetical protein